MELAKRLCDTYGPAGREKSVRKIIEPEIKKYCQTVEVDCMGNLIAYIPARRSKTKKGGKDSKIMFCAHMDEIGLIITYIDKNGFLRFTNIGVLYLGNILHKRVIFENNTIGVIGVETKPGTPRPARIDNLFIDIGVKNREEAQALVNIGDIASFYQRSEVINNRFFSKAIDDRMGCYCLIEAMKSVKNNRDDLVFVFTTQEEVGLRGARTGAYGIKPKYAIAVDATFTGDTPESPVMEVALGKGVAIKVKDSGFIANPIMINKLVTYANEAGIPYQLEILENGTTDASVVQVVREGILSGVLSIPSRYLHSTNETCDLDDVKNTIELLKHVCEKGFELL